MIKKKIFNGKRLKIARSYRGKTVDMLAKEIKVNKKDILAFEDNKYRPTPENTDKIVKALNFPKEYFFENERVRVIVEGSHFNPQSTLPRVEEMSFREQIIMTHRIYSMLNNYIEFNRFELPNIDKKLDIETIAMSLRKYWDLGEAPIENMVDIMENEGILVSSINTNKRFATPFTQKQSINNESLYLVCLGNDEGSLAIRNNDLAYELGFIVSNELNIPSKRFDKDEFCAAFLLPRDEFLNDLEKINKDDLESYINLKKKWNTPVVTMVFRAYQLEKLSYKKYNNILNEIQRKDWLNKEPLDDKMKSSNPSLLRDVLDTIIDENIMSKDECIEKLSEVDVVMDKKEIENLIG